MGEKLVSNTERARLEEVITQRDEFLTAAKVVDELFKANDSEGVKATGLITITWKVPEGYCVEVAKKDGNGCYATKYHLFHREFFTGVEDDDPFDINNPFVANEIHAIPNPRDEIQYQFMLPAERENYHSAVVYAEDIENFFILPRANEIE